MLNGVPPEFFARDQWRHPECSMGFFSPSVNMNVTLGNLADNKGPVRDVQGAEPKGAAPTKIEFFRSLLEQVH